MAKPQAIRVNGATRGAAHVRMRMLPFLLSPAGCDVGGPACCSVHSEGEGGEGTPAAQQTNKAVDSDARSTAAWAPSLVVSSGGGVVAGGGIGVLILSVTVCE